MKSGLIWAFFFTTIARPRLVHNVSPRMLCLSRNYSASARA